VTIPACSDRYVNLRGGRVVPFEALRVAWALEDRGFRLTLEDGDMIRIVPGSALTPTDEQAIRAHKPALLALIADCESTHA
jgi:hypothetical protein